MPSRLKRCTGAGPIKLQRCSTNAQKLTACTESAVCPNRTDADFPIRLRLTWSGPEVCDEIQSVYQYLSTSGCCPPLNSLPNWNSSLDTRQYTLRSIQAIDLILTWNQPAGAWQGTQLAAWTEVLTQRRTLASFNCFTGQTTSNTVPSENVSVRDFAAFVSCSNGVVQVTGTGGLIATGSAPTPGRTGSPLQWWRDPFILPASLVVNHPCTGDLQASTLVGCQCNSLCEQPQPAGCAHTNGSPCAGPCEYVSNSAYDCPSGPVPIVDQRFLRSGLIMQAGYRGGGVVTIQRV